MVGVGGGDEEGQEHEDEFEVMWTGWTGADEDADADSPGEAVHSDPTGEAVYGEPTGEAVYGEPTGEAVYGEPTGEAVYGEPTGEAVFKWHPAGEADHHDDVSPASATLDVSHTEWSSTEWSSHRECAGESRRWAETEASEWWPSRDYDATTNDGNDNDDDDDGDGDGDDGNGNDDDGHGNYCNADGNGQVCSTEDAYHDDAEENYENGDADYEFDGENGTVVGHNVDGDGDGSGGSAYVHDAMYDGGAGGGVDLLETAACSYSDFEFESGVDNGSAGEAPERAGDDAAGAGAPTIYGPFETAQMVGWNNQGFFAGKTVYVRRVGESEWTSLTELDLNVFP
jgi:hypothetical protein